MNRYLMNSEGSVSRFPFCQHERCRARGVVNEPLTARGEFHLSLSLSLFLLLWAPLSLSDLKGLKEIQNLN